MAGVNKVIILGRLGQDPEVRNTQGGQQVATLSVATSEKYTKDGKTEERTEWHRLVLWGKQAELAGKYLKKGSECYFEGKLQTRSWEDQQNVKRYTTEIVVNNLNFVGSGNGGGGNRPPAPDDSQAPAQHQTSAQHQAPIADEDVPF